MTLLETRLSGIKLFELRAFGDDRGWFSETFQRERYREAGLEMEIVQSNVSVSNRKGVLRGLHAQMPSPQGKLVSVLRGAVWDVVVDIRRDSPDFGQWEGFELTAANHRQLWVPPGFLHGFLVCKRGTVFSYHVTAPYDPNGDFAVRWDDPDIGIEWPLEGEPLLSSKDKVAPLLADLPEHRY
ncbi:dTDP-4-dehydrorhamnose 3,5-epimerase [bacterium]|nr:MAG: dTDP-4-dehydrorhamnose 3,5-epimerase [bacterium]